MQYSKILLERGIVRHKSMVTQSQLTHIKFVAKLDNIKTFYTALKAINFNENANLSISDDGLKAVVEDSKFVQASLYITRSCFSEFRLQNNEEISIRLSLSVITDCLSIFANPDCCMKIMYKGQGAPLVLILEQHDTDDLITEVSVKTKNDTEQLEFTIDEENDNYNSLIIRGPNFFNLFNEISKSADEIEILISPKSPNFQITALGETQAESKMEIAKSSDMFITYYCRKETKARYKTSHIRMMMKALGLATKVALRTDETGLLGLQIMVLSEGDSQIYIEYFITPLIEDDE